MTSLASCLTLGLSGLRVSPIAMGTMTFGEDHGWGANPEVPADMIAAYLDRGGNFIDCDPDGGGAGRKAMVQQGEASAALPY